MPLFFAAKKVNRVLENSNWREIAKEKAPETDVTEALSKSKQLENRISENHCQAFNAVSASRFLLPD